MDDFGNLRISERAARVFRLGCRKKMKIKVVVLLLAFWINITAVKNGKRRQASEKVGTYQGQMLPNSILLDNVSQFNVPRYDYGTQRFSEYETALKDYCRQLFTFIGKNDPIEPPTAHKIHQCKTAGWRIQIYRAVDTILATSCQLSDNTKSIFVNRGHLMLQLHCLSFFDQ